MNYRHAFHAGNFADIFKHAVLARVIVHLRKKEAAFRVIDTHAGAGRYDLTGGEAARSGEWRGGIGRVRAYPPRGETAALMEPLLARLPNPDEGEDRFYPGSPLIALALIRPQDRLICCELHPDERRALTAAIQTDSRAKVAEIDGWTALRAFLPPPERRGLVLVDPPFEEGDDFRRFEAGLTDAHRRWATGIFLFWYPIKEALAVEDFARRLRRLRIPKILRVELAVSARPSERLAACGMIVVNPPWGLADDLGTLLPYLSRTLDLDGTGRYRMVWLAGEAS